MTKDSAAAIRYARALEAALESDAEVERTAEELSVVAVVFSDDPATAEILSGPALPAEQRKALLETLIRGARLSPKTAHFLRLLDERGSLALLPQVSSAIEKIRDRRLGIIEAEVTTAVPMNGDLAARTRETLEQTTGRKVRLALRTDSSLIGGIVARVGSIVYDGSLRTRLEAMRAHIARG